jgi:hypothetical protein
VEFHTYEYAKLRHFRHSAFALFYRAKNQEGRIECERPRCHKQDMATIPQRLWESRSDFLNPGKGCKSGGLSVRSLSFDLAPDKLDILPPHGKVFLATAVNEEIDHQIGFLMRDGELAQAFEQPARIPAREIGDGLKLAVPIAIVADAADMNAVVRGSIKVPLLGRRHVPPYSCRLAEFHTYGSLQLRQCRIALSGCWIGIIGHVVSCVFQYPISNFSYSRDIIP